MKKLLLALPLIIAAPLIAANHAGKHSGSGKKAMMAHKPIDVSKVTSGIYAADPGHTLVGWRVNHFGFNDYFGIFGDASGTLTLDPKSPAKSAVSISIPISKVTTASAGLTSHLLRAGKDGAKPDFFGPDAGEAKFVSTSVMLHGSQMAMMTGNLTLMGVTKPVTLHVQLSGTGTHPYNKKETVGFHAKGMIKRSEWGLGFGAPAAVSDEVHLDITSAFEKAPG
jgi:polyisoprenoid-binding protein YceI